MLHTLTTVKVQHRFCFLHHSHHYRHHLQHNQDLGSLWAKVDKMLGLATTQADFDRVVSVWPTWQWSSLGGCCMNGGERHWLTACTPSHAILGWGAPPPERAAGKQTRLLLLSAYSKEQKKPYSVFSPIAGDIYPIGIRPLLPLTHQLLTLF